METFQFRAMNSQVILVAEGQPQDIAAGFAAARDFIEAGERRFTRFSPDSELSFLNHSQGAWQQVSPEMFEVLTLAHSYYLRSAGLFDPSILPDLKRVGYDRSMDQLRIEGAVNPASQPTPHRAHFGDLQMDEALGTVWLPPGLEIDLGGIAKGWIVEQAVAVLASYTDCCAVSAGGDMVLHGLPAGQTTWEIELEDPRDPSATLAVFQAEPGAIATSSITKRSWRQGEIPRHHLIDPRSGEPAGTDWLSVTVVAPDAVSAEVIAKVLLIAGSAGAAQVAYQNPQISFIAVDPEGNLWGSQNALELNYANTLD